VIRFDGTHGRFTGEHRDVVICREYFEQAAADAPDESCGNRYFDRRFVAVNPWSKTPHFIAHASHRCGSRK